MRNIETREGYEFWDKICALKHYGFIHSPDNSRVLKAEGIGNWIDMHEAQSVVDEAQEEVNGLKGELAALREELVTARRDEHNSEVAYKAAIEKQNELRTSLEAVTLNLSRVDDCLFKKSLRLTAAEQRNADAIRLLAALYDATDVVWPDVADFLVMVNPTESGASE